MSQGIIDTLKLTAHRHGACDPLWLKNNDKVVFSTVEEGTAGPEVILLHGLLGALSNWESLSPLLAKYAKAIALQFPILSGHRSEVRVKALAVYTEYLIRERNLGPVALCGNSLGGHVAMRLCLASPELVDCLILSGTSGLYEHSVDSLPIRPDKKFVREHMSRVFNNQKFVTEEAIDEIAGILASRSNTLNLIHAARSAKKDNLLSVLPQIKVPTLLLWGEDDTVTTMDVAETFHKHIPNSKLVSIKNCGHAPMIEHPEWFSEQVEKFLREHSRHFKKKV
jgi:2-hydroxy-6-oxonona-2,4-dienedioate hydrolase